MVHVVILVIPSQGRHELLFVLTLPVHALEELHISMFPGHQLSLRNRLLIIRSDATLFFLENLLFRTLLMVKTVIHFIVSFFVLEVILLSLISIKHVLDDRGFFVLE